MQEILQYLFSGITNGAIYAIIAIGFSMLYSSTDLINFAHGEFVMLGALGIVTLWGKFAFPLPIAIIITIFMVAAVGFLFERFAIRTVKKPKPIVLIIITVGASIFLRGVAMILWGKDPFSVPQFTKHAPFEFFKATILPQSIWIILTVIILGIGLHFFFRKSLTGKAMIACAINKHAAWLIGIASKKMIMLAFMISAGVGGIAGIFIAPITMNSYDMGTMLGLKGFCAAMIGGLGSLWGALAGGFILGILEAIGVGVVSSSMKDAIAFLLLLLILYIRPTGLFASGEVQRF